MAVPIQLLEIVQCRMIQIRLARDDLDCPALCDLEWDGQSCCPLLAEVSHVVTSGGLEDHNGAASLEAEYSSSGGNAGLSSQQSPCLPYWESGEESTSACCEEDCLESCASTPVSSARSQTDA